MTNTPLLAIDNGSLPILLMNGSEPEILEVHPDSIPPPPPGSTFLVPVGKEKDVQRSLRARKSRNQNGGWVLRVRQLGAARQHIELYWVSDGYRGAVYEATQRTVTFKYRKMTGPGFGIVVSALAMAMTVVIWSVLFGALRIRTGPK